MSETEYCHALSCYGFAPCAQHGPKPRFMTAELHGKTKEELEAAEEQAAARRAEHLAQKVATAARLADTEQAHHRKSSLKTSLTKEEIEAREAAAEERRKQHEHAKVEKAHEMADIESAKKRRDSMDLKRVEDEKHHIAKKHSEAEERLKSLEQQREAEHQRRGSQAEIVKARAAEHKKEGESTDIPHGKEIPRDLEGGAAAADGAAADS